MAVPVDDAMPTHDEIASYWYCRALPGSENYVPLIDLGEPECFACGWCRVEHVTSKKALEKRWKGLERAHVVPRSLGGADTVDNIILLCERCHEESPDTADAHRLWRWVIDHPRSGSFGYVFQLDGPQDPRIHKYTGPQAHALRALASLSADEWQTLIELQKGHPTRDLVRLMREAGARIGGVSTHWGIGYSSGTVAEILREAVRQYLDQSRDKGVEAAD
uniref:HNH endonuclease n=1 Tax=Nonomuraea pusilla TaxID=46177 RepID=UPI0009E74950